MSADIDLDGTKIVVAGGKDDRSLIEEFCFLTSTPEEMLGIVSPSWVEGFVGWMVCIPRLTPN